MCSHHSGYRDSSRVGDSTSPLAESVTSVRERATGRRSHVTEAPMDGVISGLPDRPQRPPIPRTRTR